MTVLLLGATYYATGDSLPEAPPEISVGLLVDDDGRSVVIEDGVVHAGAQGDVDCKEIGSRGAVAPRVNVGQVADMRPAPLEEAMLTTVGCEITAGGPKLSSAAVNLTPLELMGCKLINGS